MSNLNIVIPMAGAGARFSTMGYKQAKPFIEFAGRTMIEHVLRGLACPQAQYTLIIRNEFKQDYKSQLEHLSSHYTINIATVDKMTAGAACTALSVHKLIDHDVPVLFADADTIFAASDINAMIADAKLRGLYGSLLTFSSDKPCYSYVKTDLDGYALVTREKEVISSHAIAGAYYFAKARYFFENAIDMLIYGDTVKGEYYMSNVYNYMLRKSVKIGIYQVAEANIQCVGTPAQLELYLQSKQLTNDSI